MTPRERAEEVFRQFDAGTLDKLEQEEYGWLREVIEHAIGEAEREALAISDIHTDCGMCGKSIESNVYVRLNDKYVHQSCHVEGIVAECEANSVANSRAMSTYLRERDEAREEAKEAHDAIARFEKASDLAHRLVEVANKLTDQRDRRIAELEAALHTLWTYARTECGDWYLAADRRRLADVVDAALSPVRAQPATAAKEEAICTSCDYYTPRWCPAHAAPPSPAAREDEQCDGCGHGPHRSPCTAVLLGHLRNVCGCDAVISSTHRHPVDLPVGVGDGGRDPIPSHAKVVKLVPLQIKLVTFRDGDRWAAEVHGYTVDVDTGLPTRIRTRGHFANDPTPEDLHGLVTTWLDHELREQLGMKPHAVR